jgi:hypothetical protein
MEAPMTEHEQRPPDGDPTTDPPTDTFPPEPVRPGPVEATPVRPRDLRRPFALGAAVTAGALVAGIAATMGAGPPSASTALGGTDLAGLTVSRGATSAVTDGGWVYDGPGLGRHGARAGFGAIEITAISGSSVSLRTEDGWTRTISVSDDVTITKAGFEIGLEDLVVGDTVRLGQTRNDEGTWTVTHIVVVVPTAAGTVTAVAADSITIRVRGGTTEEIATTASTVYRVGSDTGTRADVVVGAAIVAAGTEDADGDVTATTVVVAVPRVLGQVTAKTASTITIERRDGSSLTIHVDADTDYTVAGDADATLADVEVDMWLVAKGPERADGSIDAQAIRAAAAGEGLRGFGFGRGHGHGPGPGGDLAPDADPDTDASGTS